MQCEIIIFYTNLKKLTAERGLLLPVCEDTKGTLCHSESKWEILFRPISGKAILHLRNQFAFFLWTMQIINC